MSEPIAIVGMACRFPGGVTDPASFWQLLRRGANAVGRITRPGLDDCFDERPRTPGRTSSPFGGFLTDDLEMFDAAFFGISPREASTMAPEQRLLLETAWEAYEDATIDPRAHAGERVGVFVGQWVSDFESRLFASPDEVDLQSTNGSGRYASAGRLSYVLDATGPCMTIDTACSSSLVALHLACRSLRSGESAMALAAGVNIILQPQITIAYSQSSMMAPDGRCKFGDAGADGYVRGEGVAAVLLKRLADAIDDGDHVRAVIRGSAVNNDGRGSGQLSRPSRAGQAAMLRAAYEDAGVSPGSVGYVEAHGTGTRVGDPVEFGALEDVIGAARPSDRPCRVGSVKTNIGHAEGAAGLAGLMKCVLMLEHAEIPASLHLDEPNPAIPWDQLPFEIPTSHGPWAAEDGRPRLAGVSTYGVTGTNAHVVVEEWPRRTDVAHESSDPDRAMPLVLSAASPAALFALAGAYAGLLADGTAAPRDVCATAALHRAELEHRCAFIAADRADLVARLGRFAGGDVQAADSVRRVDVDGPRRIAFVFPGQGGQWTGMARELLATEPAFAAAIDACDDALPPGTDWTVRSQLEAEGGAAARMHEIAVLQPVLLAVEIALAATWRSWGIEPDAVVGHSMGEVGAAHLAGALTIEDAMHVICARSELLQRTSGAGAMALLDLSVEEAAARIAPFGARVVVAVTNGPRSTVVSGDPDEVAAVLAGCERDGIFGRAVKVDVASHSAQMDPLVPELVARLDGLEPRRTWTRLYSTVDAAARPGETWDPPYWGRNLRQPVLFGRTIEQIVQDGIDTVIELSPHPTLLPSLTDLGPAAEPLLTIGSLRRGEPERAAMLAGLAALWTSGHPVDWSRQFPASSFERVHLPRYPWQRERHWAEAAAPVAVGGGQRRRAAPDPAVEQCLHVMRWQLLPMTSRGRGVGGRWLLVGGADEVDGLRASLVVLGATVDVAPSVADAAPLTGIDDLQIVLFAGRPAVAFDVLAALQTLQQAGPADRRSASRLWWVTRGAHVIGDDAPPDDAPEQAAMWGAARVVAVEHPDWWGGVVDLDPARPAAAQADALADQLTAGDGEDQVALRAGARHVLRLVPASAPSGPAAREWRRDAAYLVTGGLGGVAEHLAMAMVRAGARRLVLLGRSALPPRAEWGAAAPETLLGRRIAAVRALEHAGAAVHLVQADVADEAQVRAALDAYAAEGWPPIAGVVHAAGVLDNRLTTDLDRETFDAVLRGKLVGGRVLDRLLPDLDVFIMCSSMMSFWPPAGMANYAAANAGLDALAQVRRARGQHALSIQWGPWADVGLIERSADRNIEAFAREGVGSLAPVVATACYDALLTCDEPVVAAVPIDWTTFRAAHRGRDIALFRDAPGDSHGPADAADGLAGRVAGAAGLERRTLLVTLVRDTVAAVLRLPADRLDAQRPFGALGFDSLMALELRNRLETALERALPATLAWNYPTVDALAAHLDALVDTRSTVPADALPVVDGPDASAATDVFDASELLDSMAALSDDDALRTLRGGR